MSVVGVRSFRPADRAAVRDISYRSGFMGDSAESFWRHKESWADLWTSYYTDQEPESLHVATMDDAVVGYPAGCRNTAAMRPSTEELTKAVIRRHWLLFRPAPSGARYRVGCGADGAVAATAAGGRFTGSPSAHAGREHARAQVLREVRLPQPRESQPWLGGCGARGGNGGTSRSWCGTRDRLVSPPAPREASHRLSDHADGHRGRRHRRRPAPGPSTGCLSAANRQQGGGTEASSRPGTQRPSPRRLHRS
jgi:hypothetical protein